MRFSRWFYDAVLSLHKKQKGEMTEFRNRIRKYIKLFNPSRYQFMLDRDKVSSKKTYIRNEAFIRKTKTLSYKLNKKQQELL
jgi:hypothetical protein